MTDERPEEKRSRSIARRPFDNAGHLSRESSDRAGIARALELDMSSLRWIASQGFVWMVALLSWGSEARAQSDASADASVSSDEVQQVARGREAVRNTVAIAGSTTRAGTAMIAIDAPLSTVRQVVTDYAHYQGILPGVQKSRILGKTAAGTDVYLQAPILHGAATVWAVVRFAPPVRDGSGERIEGRKTGPANVDDLRAIWHLYPVDTNRTVLSLELLMVPSLPLPGALLTPQLAESSEDAVRACRTRIESIARAPDDRATVP